MPTNDEVFAKLKPLSDDWKDKTNLFMNVGRFAIHRRIVRMYPAIMQRICCSVVIVDAQYMFNLDAIEYKAYGPQFRRLSSDDPIPAYDVQVDEEGNVNFELLGVCQTGMHEPEITQKDKVFYTCSHCRFRQPVALTDERGGAYDRKSTN